MIKFLIIQFIEFRMFGIKTVYSSVYSLKLCDHHAIISLDYYSIAKEDLHLKMAHRTHFYIKSIPPIFIGSADTRVT